MTRFPFEAAILAFTLPVFPQGGSGGFRGFHNPFWGGAQGWELRLLHLVPHLDTVG